jgi:SH3-like domain-containing protein
MYEKPDAGSPVRFRAQPGVVGRISKCDPSWCRLDVGGREGYIRTDHIWGVDAGERID